MQDKAALPEYEVYALRYASMDRKRSANFIVRNPYDEHDGPMPMDFFVWLLKSVRGNILVDTGFGEQAARERDRVLDCCPIESLRVLGVAAEEVSDVILTHLHYDHAGNIDKLPNATFHVQEAEMEYATGRCMCHRMLRHAYSVEDVVGLVRNVYRDRVQFHAGNVQLFPGVELVHIGGHTKGLQAVRVHTQRGWILLASDASHYYANTDDANPFPIVYNVADMLEGHKTCRKHADSAEHVIPGHDPLVLERYPAYPTDACRIACLHRAPRVTQKLTPGAR
ncbi:MAG TPA: N-acyl homoserine lactonase family protein [Noviherbaspirillum sp.]